MSFYRFFRPYRARLVVGVVWLLATIGLEKGIPWTLMLALDALGVESQLGLVARYAVAVVILAIAMAITRTLSRAYIFDVGREVEYNLRNELLRRLHCLGPSFFQRMPTGEIMSRATSDVGQLRVMAGFGLLNVVNALIAYSASIALMLYISPKLTAYALIPYPVFALCARLFSRAFYKRSMEAQAAIGRLTQTAQQHIEGIRLTRAFALRDIVNKQFQEASAGVLRQTLSLVVLRGAMWPVLSSLGAVGSVVVIGVGGAMVLDGEISIGEFAAFNAYLGQLVWPTLALGYVLTVVQRGRASFQRIRAILEEPVMPEAQVEASQPSAQCSGQLEVKHLSFNIDDKPVLRDCSFEIPARSFAAIVGKTGSGKTTLVNLLVRMLPTPNNSVFLDGRDLRDYTHAQVHQHVVYAQQEPFLFSSTVARNIGFAFDAIDEPVVRAQVRQAAKQAGILDEIEAMPQGFDTRVGERGLQLSGGQKQRVALARAIASVFAAGKQMGRVGSPCVLVLDDPLSAVDTETQSKILSSLTAHTQHTLVLVTHRVAAAKHADQVIVMDHGTVVENGSHQALLRGGGVYARLAELQRLDS